MQEKKLCTTRFFSCFRSEADAKILLSRIKKLVNLFQRYRDVTITMSQVGSLVKIQLNHVMI